MILKSELNAKNQITAIGALAVPVLRHSFGIINLRLEEIRKIDRKTRKVLTTRGVTKTTVNAAAECNLLERQGSSIWEVAHRNLVTVCNKFQLVRCSQSSVSYG